MITFTGKGVTLDVEEGVRLSECIRRAGFSIETPCNCIGKCGKCRVVATGELSPPTPEETLLTGGEENVRLACMARITGDAEIELLADAGPLKAVDLGFSVNTNLDSDTVRRKLPAGEGRNTIEEVLFGNRVLDSAVKIGSILGVAIDIGTTGITAYLVDLEHGGILSRLSCLNPQAQFGSDVLSRISYCMNDKAGPAALKRVMIDKINELVEALLRGGSTEKDGKSSVYRMTVAGNTTMLHFFTGTDACSIARAPYTPVFIDRVDVPASELGIDIHIHGIVTLLPSASGYVGADILAGVVATAFDKKPHPSLFIDIGTNGEIVVVSEGRLAATSTAAGPALEGMNISCGCRAEDGAIDTFLMDDDYGLSFTTIGEVKPKGICGSGLIDLAACLVRNGIVLPSGKLNPGADGRVRHRIIDKRFHITDELYLSQKDIRQIQLAKGAIAAGITLLLEEMGIPLESVREAVIAGSFGYHINPESLLEIGLIPKGFTGEISFAGNSSVEGARMALLNRKALEKMTAMQGVVRVLELSTNARFQDVFVKELGF